MRPVLLAMAGYGWGIAHDIASRKRLPYAKPPLMLVMVASHIAAILTLALRSRRFPLPRPLQALFVVLAPLSFAAMLYSLLFEIPLRKAWLERGHMDELVTDGTYALARHPGVIWYTCWVLCTALAARSWRLLAAAPVLVAGDVGHVAFQERAVLTKEFGDAYREYQRSTPFVVPNRQSLRRFLSGLRRGDGA